MQECDARPADAGARRFVDEPQATLSQLRELREAGLRLIDEAPRTGIRGSQVAFLHPATAGGVLTELVTPVEVHP